MSLRKRHFCMTFRHVVHPQLDRLARLLTMVTAPAPT